MFAKLYNRSILAGTKLYVTLSVLLLSALLVAACAAPPPPRAAGPVSGDGAAAISEARTWYDEFDIEQLEMFQSDVHAYSTAFKEAQSSDAYPYGDEYWDSLLSDLANYEEQIQTAEEAEIDPADFDILVDEYLNTLFGSVNAFNETLQASRESQGVLDFSEYDLEDDDFLGTFVGDLETFRQDAPRLRQAYELTEDELELFSDLSTSLHYMLDIANLAQEELVTTSGTAIPQSSQIAALQASAQTIAEAGGTEELDDIYWYGLSESLGSLESHIATATSARVDLPDAYWDELAAAVEPLIENVPTASVQPFDMTDDEFEEFMTNLDTFIGAVRDMQTNPEATAADFALDEAWMYDFVEEFSGVTAQVQNLPSRLQISSEDMSDFIRSLSELEQASRQVPDYGNADYLDVLEYELELLMETMRNQ